MAIGISDAYVSRNTQGPAQDRLRTVIRTAAVVEKYRKVRRVLARFGTLPTGVAQCLVTENLDRCAAHFHEHRWALIENFFSDDFHAELVAQWPQRYQFGLPGSTEKSYDTGFACRWTGDGVLGAARLERYGALSRWVRYLGTDECAERFSAVFGMGANLKCSSFLMQMTREGSQVVPHKDSKFLAEHPKHVLNILVFINGQGGDGGGGLALSRDNELQDVIVEARSLRNTALLYDVKAEFFHGFKPVAPGKFRWSLSSEFFDEGARI